MEKVHYKDNTAIVITRAEANNKEYTTTWFGVFYHKSSTECFDIYKDNDALYAVRR